MLYCGTDWIGRVSVALLRIVARPAVMIKIRRSHLACNCLSRAWDAGVLNLGQMNAQGSPS